MLTFLSDRTRRAPVPLPPADLTETKPLRRRELLLLALGRRTAVLAAAMWLIGLLCTSTASMLPRELFFVAIAVALAGYAGAGAIMLRAVRRHHAIPSFDMMVCHSLYRLGVPWPIGYVVSRPEAVRAYEAVHNEIISMKFLDHVADDVRWRIVAELIRSRAHALAMLAFMLDDPAVAERIPSLIAERATTDPLRIHSLLTAVAPGTEGPLGAGAL